MDIRLLTDHRAFEHALKSIEGAEYLEQGLQHAQQSIAPNPNASMYAIVWDGFETLDGKKWDTVLVEVGAVPSRLWREA